MVGWEASGTPLFSAAAPVGGGGEGWAVNLPNTLEKMCWSKFPWVFVVVLRLLERFLDLLSANLFVWRQILFYSEDWVVAICWTSNCVIHLASWGCWETVKMEWLCTSWAVILLHTCSVLWNNYHLFPTRVLVQTHKRGSHQISLTQFNTQHVRFQFIGCTVNIVRLSYTWSCAIKGAILYGAGMARPEPYPDAV